MSYGPLYDYDGELGSQWWGYFKLGPVRIPPIQPTVGMVDRAGTGQIWYLFWDGEDHLLLSDQLPASAQNVYVFQPYDGPYIGQTGWRLGVTTAATEPEPTTWSLIASTSQAGSSSVSNPTTPAIDCRGADLLVAMVVDSSSGSPGTLSDSLGNIWTTGPSVTFAPGRVLLYYATGSGVLTGASQTFTYTGPNTTPSIAVQAWKGSVGNGVEQSAANAAFTTSLDIGSITPAQPGELIISAFGQYDFNGPTNYTVNNGTVAQMIPFASGNTMGLGFSYYEQSTAALLDTTWSWTPNAGNNVAAGIVVSFQLAKVPVLVPGPHLVVDVPGTFEQTRWPSAAHPLIAPSVFGQATWLIPESTGWPAPQPPTVPGIPSSSPVPSGGGYAAFETGFATNAPPLVSSTYVPVSANVPQPWHLGLWGALS